MWSINARLFPTSLPVQTRDSRNPGFRTLSRTPSEETARNVSTKALEPAVVDFNLPNVCQIW